jgi:flagellar motor switch/type III secretory pathway protein FliN
LSDNPNTTQSLSKQHLDSLQADSQSSGESSSDSYAPYPLAEFATSNSPHSQDSINQQTLTLTIELGDQLLDQQTVQELKPGSRIMLKQQATQPVDLYIKQQCVGQGELLIRDNKLCIRITQLLANTLRRSA